jgi:hypothetical protein
VPVVAIEFDGDDPAVVQVKEEQRGAAARGRPPGWLPRQPPSRSTRPSLRHRNAHSPRRPALAPTSPQVGFSWPRPDIRASGWQGRRRHWSWRCEWLRM